RLARCGPSRSVAARDAPASRRPSGRSNRLPSFAERSRTILVARSETRSAHIERTEARRGPAPTKRGSCDQVQTDPTRGCQRQPETCKTLACLRLVSRLSGTANLTLPGGWPRDKFRPKTVPCGGIGDAPVRDARQGRGQCGCI